MGKVQIRYLLSKGDSLYYNRRIPEDLRSHYPKDRKFIRVNLHTQDPGKAAQLIPALAAKDDALWSSLRSGLEQPSTTPKPPPPAVSSDTSPKKRILLSNARALYISEHRHANDARFLRDTNRAIDLVISTVGDLPLASYTREHARAVRDVLIPNHSTATVRRRLNVIAVVFNVGRNEFNLQIPNPFSRMAIQGEGLDSVKRLPFTTLELFSISTSCRKLDDDIRHIIALQLASGARLSEIVGLRREDVVLNYTIPYLNMQPHEALGRTLKTPGSIRVIPLLGIGLWAARRAIEANTNSEWLFPRYAKDNDIRATHASNTINKYLSDTLHIEKTSHSFRHSIKDLLRNSGCPDPIQRQLLGHASTSVANSYGLGYHLPILRDALQKAIDLVFPRIEFKLSGESKDLTTLD